MGEMTCKTMLRSYCFGNGSTTFDGLKKRNFSPRFQACRRAKSARTKGMTRKNKRGFGGEKPNQRRTRQSIHLAIAAKCFFALSQAISSQAIRKITHLFLTGFQPFAIPSNTRSGWHWLWRWLPICRVFRTFGLRRSRWWNNLYWQRHRRIDSNKDCFALA